MRVGDIKRGEGGRRMGKVGWLQGGKEKGFTFLV